jgi:tRNA threonylcarbamoyladenosine biosynthesis protein TsaE
MERAFGVSLNTPEEMIRLGALIGRHLFEGAVVGLTGPLGAGKTTIARGIAEGLGIRDGFVLSSPTYTIMQVYPCSELELHHLDLYRISGVDDLDSTGYRDASGKGKVLIVEWPEREPSVLPDENLQIRIEYTGSGRDVVILAVGSCYEKSVKEIVDSGDWLFVPGFIDTNKDSVVEPHTDS